MFYLSKWCTSLTGADTFQQLFFQYDFEDYDAIAQTFRLRFCRETLEKTQRGILFWYR